VLREVSLSIGAGEHVAVIGVSGAGKSSLLGLLLGWHTPAAGGIMVDGVTLDALTLERLRRGTAWVDPAVALWNQSLADNLGYASADGAVSRFGPAIDAARLRGVVQKLPRGLQTLLGEGGGLLSGGEGQRVRLARALLMEAPRLVLLDEPFRGLDRSQRAALLGEARAWWRASTLLCVTHDVGETQGFDRVLVVEGGRVVEDGSPQVLLSSESRYRALLEAERRLAEQVWGGGPWRRLRVEGGRVVEAGARS
jgi:ATP-binding cassette subfamily B protein